MSLAPEAMTDATDVRNQLEALLAKRILVLDGAMGTMVQRFALSEADFRGERFKDHPKDLRGNNDVLVLTRPDVIADIHRQYLAAGSDIIETNTFSGTAVAQADYGLEPLVYEINVEGARLARAACDEYNAEFPSDAGLSPARSVRRTAFFRSRPTSTTRRSATSPSTRCATRSRNRPAA